MDERSLYKDISIVFLRLKIINVTQKNHYLCHTNFYTNMQYFQRYNTPQGFDDLLMESNGEALCWLHFVSKNKNFP